MNKKLYISLIFTLSVFALHAQDEISGKIFDRDGSPVEGVKVYVLNNPGNSAISDKDGLVTIITEMKNELILSYDNQYKASIFVEGNEFSYTFGERDMVNELGYFDLSNEQVTQAVSSVRSEQLDQNSSTNIYHKLYGLLPGLTVLQDSEWNGDSKLIVRGGATSSNREPLIVVDGFVRPMEYLSVSEIESVSVLKDGAATALYGSRGANGVIVVKTKRGAYQSSKISIQYTYGLGLPMNMPEMADAFTYANAVNEALKYDGLFPKYSELELGAIKSNYYPDLYPNVDWVNQGMKNHTSSHQLNVAFSGGNDRVRHFTSVEYLNDTGLLNGTGYDDRYSSQMKEYALNLRVNLDVDITKTTKLALGILGMLRETNKPAGGDEEDLFGDLFSTPSLAFPVTTSSGAWGSDNIRKSNPIANISDVGYYQQNQRLLQSNLSLSQDLSVIVKGLSAEIAVYWDNMATNYESQKKTYLYEVNTPTMDKATGEILDVMSARYGINSPLEYASGLSNQYMRSALEAKINYNANFSKSTINASAIYRQENNVPKERNTTRKYQYFLGIIDYNYANKYFFNFVANYYGSSVMSAGNRYKFYPAVSAAWLISSENFMKGSAFNMLKLRASAGKSGYINFGYDLDQFTWSGGATYYFGSSNASQTGYLENQLPVNNLTCETSLKYNIGVDIELFKKLSFTADAYYENRSDILMETTSLNSLVVGIDPPQSNDGEVNVKGLEAALSWRDKIGNFSYYVGGNFSFARSEIIENNEGIKAEDYLSRKGHRLNQYFGLESIGFFNDWDDINSSPTQTFSEVRPGDIKYKDQNGDNIINSNDIIAQGYSTAIPEIYYGINIGFNYKGFGIDALFQGVGNYSVSLDSPNIYRPLYDNRNISTWYLNDNVRWTEQTMDTANLPRLTTKNNKNNFRESSLWLRKGDYFKLRNLNVYYNFPQKWVSKMKMQNLQIYVRGNNLFSIDDIDYSNSENIGINYPDFRSVYLGINLKF